MDLIQSYEDNDLHYGEKEKLAHENAYSSPESSPPRLLPAKSSAPKVDDTMLALTVAQAHQSLSKPIDPVQHAVVFNPTYDQLWAPVYGPAHPYAKDGIALGLRNHKLGFVEDAAIDSFVFDEQYNTFHKYGYAADPSASAGNNFVGDLEALNQNKGISVYNIPQLELKRPKLEKKKEVDEDGIDNGDVDATEVENPATDAWLLKNKKSPWAGKKEGVLVELTEEQKKYAEEYAKKKEEKGQGGDKGEVVADKSTFHGKELRDYQGRSWIAPPKDKKATNDHCYIPKRLVHTWSGHTMGVSAIRFFPKYGHLILSAG